MTQRHKHAEQLLLGLVLIVGFIASVMTFTVAMPVDDSNATTYCWSDPANNGQRTCGARDAIPVNAFNIRSEG